MKRIFAAVSGISLLVALTVGAAASLGGITPNDLGADDAAVASCDIDGVTASYTVAYESTPPGYEVTGVTVGAIDSTCSGQTVDVTLTADGVNIGDGQATADGSGSVAVTIDEEPSAETVNDIHIAIHE